MSKDIKQYFDFPDFEYLYLEDSWVLQIESQSNDLEFTLDAVLTEEHPFSKPLIDEQYCYRKTKIIFQNCKNINWIERSANYNKDSKGEIDYGNIDWFYYQNKTFCIGGEWGKLEIIEPEILRVLI